MKKHFYTIEIDRHQLCSVNTPGGAGIAIQDKMGVTTEVYPFADTPGLFVKRNGDEVLVMPDIGAEMLLKIPRGGQVKIVGALEV